ncbi:hypothetical protein QEK78_001792 [Stenotrophomonas maltophilia]|nr:sel1 repeat family protein [Stenotrophomonas maltophilia]
MKLTKIAVLAIIAGGLASAIALALREDEAPPPLSATASSPDVVRGKTTADGTTAPPPFTRRELGRSFVFARGPELRPPGDPRAWIDSLRPAAEAGDANASYSIYLTLVDCEMYLKASASEELAESRAIGASPEYEKKVLRKLIECGSLPPSQTEEIGQWLSKAASQGSIEALVAYAARPNAILGPKPDVNSDEFKDWQSNAVSYLNEAMLKGSIDALAQLSNAYMAGYALPRDPEKAYATQLALGEINQNYSSEAYRNSIAKELTPQQLIQAREDSKKFLQIVTHAKGMEPQ